MTTLFQPGKLVSLRGRDWIVLPSEDKNLLIVKPLGGSDDEITTFDSTGLAIQDLAIALAAMERSGELDLPTIDL